MNAEFIVFAWSLALVAAIAAGLLLSFVDGVGRLAVRWAHRRRLTARPRVVAEIRADTQPHRVHRHAGRLVRAFLGAMR